MLYHVRRFLNTIPTSSSDESLLTQLLQLLTVMASTRTQRDQATLAWLADLLHDRDGALLRTLSRAEKSDGDANDSALATRRQLNRSLLKFVRATLEFSAFSVHDRFIFVACCFQMRYYGYSNDTFLFQPQQNVRVHSR